MRLSVQSMRLPDGSIFPTVRSISLGVRSICPPLGAATVRARAIRQGLRSMRNRTESLLSWLVGDFSYFSGSRMNLA
jgi:hypothetical protein